jgi:aldehyde reductase
MEEMVRKGKTKHIGVSNFNVKQVQDVLNICQIKPICNQFEVNPLLHNNELVKFCQDNDIAVVAYAPLGAPDRSWLKSEDPVPLQHPSILELAAKYKKTPAQVILRWLIQRDIIVIPKSVTPARIAENADVHFNLNQAICLII